MPKPGLPAGGLSAAQSRAVVPRAEDLPAGPGRVRPIIRYPDPVLREICAPAADMKFPELRALVADLFATLYAAGGRGLAAPQIGMSRRVFVMDAGWKDGLPAPLAVIEPQIVRRSRRSAEAKEQCLSIPGHPVEVRRPTGILLGFFDLSGMACELSLEGIEARIAQHEVDHLNGVLIVDAAAEDAANAAPGPAGLPGSSDALAGKTVNLVDRIRAGQEPPANLVE